MRILEITAGAAGMYCGSCLRDNALTAALRAAGHDVVLLPLYTPTRTDERNESEDRVFFSGISVYLEQKIPLFRNAPPILDWLFDSPAVIKAASSGSIATDPKLLGELTLSTLRGEQGFQQKEIDKLVRWVAAQRAFDVINLPNSLLIALAEPLARATKRPIVCTLQGEDLFLDGLSEAHRREAIALIQRHERFVDTFIAVSGYYAGHMARYLGVPERRVEVVPLGITLDDFGASPRKEPEPFTIGYFARVTPEKGLHLLVEAYRKLRCSKGLEAARLDVAGYLAPDQRRYLDEQQAALDAAGLGAEFRYHGAPDRDAKLRFLRGLSVLSVPTVYVESKGLFVLESLASGVPVVLPRHGAFPEMVEKTQGGLLFPPGDTDALADALLALARDAAMRSRLAANGSASVRREWGAAPMAERTLRVYERLASPSVARASA